MELLGFACLNRNALRDFHSIKLFKIKNIKKKMENNFLIKKEITWAFAIIAVISGFWFLDSGFTGNAIVNKQIPVSFLSLIGLLLVACSAILIAYSVKKR